MKWRRPVFVLLLSAAALALSLRIHARASALRPLPPQPRTFASVMPATVLWAWEEPEDLTTLDPTHTGVAYLAESLTLSDHVTIRPRYQPLNLAPGTSVMAVVRIQPATNFRDTPALRTATTSALLKVAQQPNLKAFQIDFDATASQRPFYTAILEQLRPQMPAGMPLSITALLSWCSRGDNWIRNLPIDEAVPMFFRLGGSSKPNDSKLAYRINEPLCRTSNGVSTDETWPTTNSKQRLYIFTPHPWTPQQLTTTNQPLHTELTP